MTKILVMSDLHFEGSYIDTAYGNFEHDVVVLAGDVMPSCVESMQWAERKFMKPVVFVAGNHEFYHHDIGVEIRAAFEHHAFGVHFLECDSIVLDGTRFLGMTLWTDYALDGNPERGMRIAGGAMTDHRLIKCNGGRYFEPADALVLHQRSVAWLESEFARPFDGPTVVVSHHAPSPRSVSPDFEGDPLNSAFCSDLEERILRWQPDAWIHGHVHSQHDYAIGRTRVVCNPRGYRSENRDFKRDLVIEIGAPQPRYEGGVEVDEYGYPVPAKSKDDEMESMHENGREVPYRSFR